MAELGTKPRVYITCLKKTGFSILKREKKPNIKRTHESGYYGRKKD